jgi:hypothetical protein
MAASLQRLEARMLVRLPFHSCELIMDIAFCTVRASSGGERVCSRERFLGAFLRLLARRGASGRTWR